uniref:ADF-H domain-containing protein n=1 Tax=Chrysotila carterae TaxID=13221 RepID=A0A7S4EZJ0_CHRCT
MGTDDAPVADANEADVPIATPADEPPPSTPSMQERKDAYIKKGADDAGPTNTPAGAAELASDFSDFKISSKSSKYANAGGYRLVAHGAGGIDEMREHLDNSLVMYGLLQAVIGSGFLARRKYVLLHLKGEACPAMWRMKHGARKTEVAALLGGATVEFACERKDDATIDALLEELLRHCVADDGKAQHSLASLRADLQAQLEKAQNQLRRMSFQKQGSRRMRTAVALRADIRLQEVMRLCVAPTGPINWILVNPKGELLEAGGGSIDEMRTFLQPAGVHFGMLRMAFGAGRFRRVHWLFFHWAGPDCAGVTLGRANAQRAAIKGVLKPTSIDFFANELNEFTVAIVIEKARPTSPAASVAPSYLTTSPLTFVATLVTRKVPPKFVTARACCQYLRCHKRQSYIIREVDL